MLRLVCFYKMHVHFTEQSMFQFRAQKIQLIFQKLLKYDCLPTAKLSLKF
jgi:hypothetical protein